MTVLAIFVKSHTSFASSFMILCTLIVVHPRAGLVRMDDGRENKLPASSAGDAMPQRGGRYLCTVLSAFSFG